MTDSVDGDDLPPDEAFSLLGNEIRVDIVQALWEAEASPVAFSDLRGLAGVDDSGRFNYHLGELVGTFVTRSEEGYRLTHAGVRVVGAILDGTYTREASVSAFEVGTACPSCAATLEAGYDRERFEVGCPNEDCGGLEKVASVPLPPGAISGRSRAELVGMAYRWFQSELRLMRNGICPNCAGTVSQRLGEGTDTPEGEPAVEYGCDRCPYSATGTVAVHLLTHPVVGSFFHDHGTDPAEQWWELLLPDRRTVDVRSREPWRITVVFPLDGAELEVAVDDELSVVEYERR